MIPPSNCNSCGCGLNNDISCKTCGYDNTPHIYYTKAYI